MDDFNHDLLPLFEAAPRDHAIGVLLLDERAWQDGLADADDLEMRSWLDDQIAALPHHDEEEIVRKMTEVDARLERIHVCMTWPTAYSANLALWEELHRALEKLPCARSDFARRAREDITLAEAQKQAMDRVICYDLKDRHSLCEGIAAATAKLADEENSRRYPTSTYHYRRLLVELCAFLRYVPPHTVH